MASQAVIRRYYLAMGVPFAIDVVTLRAYAAVNDASQRPAGPAWLMSTIFLVMASASAPGS